MLSACFILLPSALIALGWLMVLKKRSGHHSRMALLTVTAAVFFFGMAAALIRYRTFGLNLDNLTADDPHQMLDRLRTVVMNAKFTIICTLLNLLLAAYVIEKVTHHDRPQHESRD